MKSQCLPFSQIPHTTEIFTDFLSYSPKIQQFYPHSPRFSDWFREESAALNYDSARRVRVCATLERQNASWNAAPNTVANIARMRVGAAAVVTGQQVGLFGGPLFSLFKALTAVKLAEQATAGGVDCVPVFWLATEDHDLEEVNHVFVPGADGHLRAVVTSSVGAVNAPVGTIRFGAEIEEVIKTVAEALGESEIISIVRDAYRPGETFGTGFARLFSRLLGGWGVILVDASDPELHKIAAPIYRAAIEKAAQLDDALQARGKSLEESGYHQQVKVTPSSSLLFMLRGEARVPVHRHTGAISGSPEFVAGEEKLTQGQLVERIANAPQDFSPNVLLRPVVQDYLLPTVAYVGGPAEIAYFAQATAVYEALLSKVTPVVPRFSATVLEPKLQALLERYNLRATDVFHAPELLRETLAREAMPQALQKSFDNAETVLKKSMETIRESLSSIDKTLVESSSTAESKMLYQLNGLRSRAARAELRHSELLARHAEILSNSIYPNKNLQERELAGIYFLARYGTEFLGELYHTMQTDCLDHQIISM